MTKVKVKCLHRSSPLQGILVPLSCTHNNSICFSCHSTRGSNRDIRTRTGNRSCIRRQLCQLRYVPAVRLVGFEPTVYGLKARCHNLLATDANRLFCHPFAFSPNHFLHHCFSLLFRSPLPGIRTRMSCLGGTRLTVKREGIVEVIGGPMF